MEPVGLAVGIVGLAGLFTSCLEVINKVQLYRTFSTDSQDLNAQLTGHKLRFQRWGQHAGFDQQGQLRVDHHQALNDDNVVQAVEGLLRIITRIFQEEDARANKLLGGAKQYPGASSVLAGALSASSGQSKWEKMSWAIRGKTGRSEQVLLFGNVVQQLHDLIPVDQDTATLGLSVLSVSTALPLQGTKARSLFNGVAPAY